MKKVKTAPVVEPDQKALFIKALAKFLAGDQAKKGIMLQMPNAVAYSVVSEWAELRGCTPLFGYQTVEEAEKILTKWLRG